VDNESTFSLKFLSLGIVALKAIVNSGIDIASKLPSEE
jgi:hypothetical protein